MRFHIPADAMEPEELLRVFLGMPKDTEELDLSYTELWDSARHVVVLASALQGTAVPLKSLSLSGNAIHDTSGPDLERMLSAIPHSITSLKLNDRRLEKITYAFMGNHV